MTRTNLELWIGWPISERIGKAKPAAVTYRKGKDFGKGVRMRCRAEIMIFLSDTVFLSVPISVRTSLYNDKEIQNTQAKCTHETRSTVRNVIKTQKYNRSASQRYPNFLGPHIYNKLPLILRSGLSSNQLKKHLIDH